MESKVEILTKFGSELMCSPMNSQLSFSAPKLLLLALSFTQNMWWQVIIDKYNKTLRFVYRVP